MAVFVYIQNGKLEQMLATAAFKKGLTVSLQGY